LGTGAQAGHHRLGGGANGGVRRYFGEAPRAPHPCTSPIG
jgi:hypothetical protein